MLQMPVDLILWISSHWHLRAVNVLLSGLFLLLADVRCLATALPFCAHLLYRLCDVQRKRNTKGHALL